MANSLSRLDRNIQYNKAVDFLNKMDKLVSKDAISDNIGILKGKVVQQCKNPAGVDNLKETLKTALRVISDMVDTDHEKRDVSERLISQLTQNPTKAGIKAFINSINVEFFGSKGITSLDDFNVNEFSNNEIADAKKACEAEWNEAHKDMSADDRALLKLSYAVAHNVLNVRNEYAKGLEDFGKHPEDHRPNATYSYNSIYGDAFSAHEINKIGQLGEDFDTITDTVFRNFKAVMEKSDTDKEKISLQKILQQRYADDVKERLAESFKDTIEKSLKEFTLDHHDHKGKEYNDNLNNLGAGIAHDFFRGCNGGGMLLNATLNKSINLIDHYSKHFSPEFAEMESTIEKFGTDEDPVPFNYGGGTKFIDEKGNRYLPSAAEERNIPKNFLHCEVAGVYEQLAKMLPKNGNGYEGIMFLMTTMLSLSNTSSIVTDWNLDTGLGTLDQMSKIKGTQVILGPLGGTEGIKTDISVDEDKKNMVIEQEFTYVPLALDRVNGFKIPRLPLHPVRLKARITVPIEENKGLEVGELPKGVKIECEEFNRLAPWMDPEPENKNPNEIIDNEII